MTLFFGLIFGVIGSAYIVYGKKAFEPWFLVAGFVLIIYPYFVSNALLTLLIGAVLVVFPVAKHKGWL